MGPLIVLLLLVPFFLAAAWAFRDSPVVVGICILVAVAIPVEYARQFARFAARDPDRLQSEHYRYEMKKIQMVAAKELPFAVPADALSLTEGTSNPAQPSLSESKRFAEATEEDER